MTYYLTNARVLTMQPRAAVARSVTIVGGRISAVDAPSPAGATSVDCGGGVLLPGFIDPHVHLLAAAAARRSIDCSPRAVRSIAEIQQLLAGTAAPAEGWLRAAGYDEFALGERRHPTRWDLDAAVPGRPVRLLHRSGHAVVLNSLALELAGITIASEEPPGGVIDRRLEDGEPTGLLLDMNDVVDRVVPPLAPDELIAGMRSLDEVLLREGVTAVQDMTQQNDEERLELLDRICNAAGFRPRGLRPATRAGVRGAGPVKVMLPEAAGLTAAVRHELAASLEIARRSARQVAVHAVTAEGLRVAVETFEATLSPLPRADHRHRIEHAAVCPPEMAERVAALGLVVVSNPVFLLDHGARYRRTVPVDEQPYLYAAASLIRVGAVVAAASDTPYARPSPLDGMRAAIARQDATGANLPGERVDLHDALAMVTRNAAFAARAEDRLGRIAPGRAADLVLLDRLPSGAERPSVWWTLIAGEPAYASGDAPRFG